LAVGYFDLFFLSVPPCLREKMAVWLFLCVLGVCGVLDAFKFFAEESAKAGEFPEGAGSGDGFDRKDQE
jgi:hypothetical protein